MTEPRTGDGSKGSCRLVICLRLKLERAQGVGHGLFVDPLPDERQQAGRVADHIGKKPVDGAGNRRIQAETAPQAVIDGRHCSNSIGERGLVDAEHAAAHASENPGPATRGSAEIQAQIPRTRFLPEDGKALPQLEIGAPGRAYLIFDERHLAVGEGGGRDGRGQEQILGPERKSAEWRSGSGGSEGQRPAGYMGEFLFEQDILDALDRGDLKLEDYELSQWRLMHIGAQPVPPSLIKRWKEYFPHHQYDTNDGLSESTGPGCVHLGVENIHKVGAIGVPGYRWECKIVDENGVTVPQGEVGELCVKGPGVMTCYYRNEEATAETIRDGWLFTGDMARQDEDGFYFLVDRKKDVIVSGGENIYPVQIEDFLRKHDKIKDVAVIGLPDRRLGEKTAAIIEIKEGMTCTEEEIENFCLELPRYKRPKQIIFHEIPRNATGKIEKPKLRQMYGADKLVEKENEA